MALDGRARSLAFAVGTCLAYWMYLVQKGKHEAAYMTNATKLAAGFSGVIFVVLGGVILALSPQGGLHAPA